MDKCLIPAPIPVVNAWTSNQLLSHVQKSEVTGVTGSDENVAHTQQFTGRLLEHNEENWANSMNGSEVSFSQPMYTPKHHYYDNLNNSSKQSIWGNTNRKATQGRRQYRDAGRHQRGLGDPEANSSGGPSANTKSHTRGDSISSGHTFFNKSSKRKIKSKQKQGPSSNNNKNDFWVSLNPEVEESVVYAASAISKGYGTLGNGDNASPLSATFKLFSETSKSETGEDYLQNAFNFKEGFPAFHSQVVSADEPLNLAQLIDKQLHYYFSTENLCKDIYLRSLFDENTGAISLKELIKFNRLRFMTNDGKNIDFLKQVITDHCSDILEFVDQESVRYHHWKNWRVKRRDTKSRSSGPRGIESTSSQSNVDKSLGRDYK